MSLQTKISQALQQHPNVRYNISRREMIQAVVDNKEAVISANGALSTWTRPESSGRSPQDTYGVKRPESEANIDWDSPNNIPWRPTRSTCS